jgi:hypothetical protein
VYITKDVEGRKEEQGGIEGTERSKKGGVSGIVDNRQKT